MEVTLTTIIKARELLNNSIKELLSKKAWVLEQLVSQVRVLFMASIHLEKDQPLLNKIFLFVKELIKY